MADEKLPGYVEAAIAGAEDQQAMPDEAMAANLRAAIHRYAREREAAALERAAQVCEAVSFAEHSCATDAEYKAQRIRALIHKEPANG